MPSSELALCAPHACSDASCLMLNRSDYIIVTMLLYCACQTLTDASLDSTTDKGKCRHGAVHTLKMVLLMMSEWMAATPLTALLPTTARYAMFTSLQEQTHALTILPGPDRALDQSSDSTHL